jgi:hypothetical protein
LAPRVGQLLEWFNIICRDLQHPAKYEVRLAGWSASRHLAGQWKHKAPKDSRCVITN